MGNDDLWLRWPRLHGVSTEVEARLKGRLSFEKRTGASCQLNFTVACGLKKSTANLPMQRSDRSGAGLRQHPDDAGPYHPQGGGVGDFLKAIRGARTKLGENCPFYSVVCDKAAGISPQNAGPSFHWPTFRR